MEKPDKPLEVFSPLLLKDHIRLITVANCITNDNKDFKTIFKIAPEIYKNIMADGFNAPLIGIILQYDETKQELAASVNQNVYDMYANKIMREVALTYKENYFHRYDNFMRCQEIVA